MPRPKGGRGKQAPYQTQMVRVPVPIKVEVEKLIDDYRTQVLKSESSDSQTACDSEFAAEIPTAIKLVDKFTELIEQAEYLHDPKRRNNVNLARFRDWLTGQISQDAP